VVAQTTGGLKLGRRLIHDVGWVMHHHPVAISSSATGARSITRAVTSAVSAALAADAEAFGEAAVDLDGSRADQVDTVLSAVVRALLEDLHPGGLTSDDVHDVLSRCVRSAIDWFPTIEVGALVIVLTGALGVADAPDAAPMTGVDRSAEPTESNTGIDSADDGSRPAAVPPPDPSVLRRHAVIVIADLLAFSSGTISRYIDMALAEVARAETMEMP
jgi:hypothetical protein